MTCIISVLELEDTMAPRIHEIDKMALKKNETRVEEMGMCSCIVGTVGRALERIYPYPNEDLKSHATGKREAGWISIESAFGSGCGCEHNGT